MQSSEKITTDILWANMSLFSIMIQGL